MPMLFCLIAGPTASGSRPSTCGRIAAKQRNRQLDFSLAFLASICDGVSPACGDSHVSQIVGLKQFTFIGNQTNSTIEASIFRLLWENAWLIHNKNSTERIKRNFRT